jgi:hypothetical protein
MSGFLLYNLKSRRGSDSNYFPLAILKQSLFLRRIIRSLVVTSKLNSGPTQKQEENVQYPKK